ncbi:MAG: type I glyceraldehyde-3-phosphate dehydrogenase [Planctomycetota bacterium]|jgi:glyceraldehyde 3-phosphate dehydrogenase|nr:type I glyceraldehyde-3-phosphate dehydrogenase [Planctomycetota bacterium]
MTIRIGINGFGRIGRCVFRILHQFPEEFEVVAINDLASSTTLAHLLQYDSVLGRFPHPVRAVDGGIEVGDRSVRIDSERDPAQLPWGELGVDFAVESTGVFRSRIDLEKHLEAGAGRVVLSAPAKDEMDATVVMGVNHHTLQPEDRLLSNASCTTNCLATMVKVLHDTFGVREGLMTTIHAYTNDQRVLDVEHSDLRRARAAALNIIPTSTGAASAVGKVLPELEGRIDGMAMRVPVPDGSIVDFVARLESQPSRADIHQAFELAADGDLAGFLRVCHEPIVSSDILGDPHSCILDGLSTMVLPSGFVKVVGWYDNEWGYSNRLVDLIRLSHGLR